MYLVIIFFLSLATLAGAAAAAEPAPFRDCPDCPEMVPLAGGAVRLGDGASGPEVVVAPFAIARTEVTVGQWEVCVLAHACREHRVRWGGADMPMTDITAADAEDYVAWLSRLGGGRYRLPTEAEWEYAAKAGTVSRYPWGDAMEPGRAVCQNCDPRFSHRPAPVATMAANPFGLFDMNGNVWEWTADAWDGDPSRRVVKGGSWYFVPAQSRSASRSPEKPLAWGYDIGFRPVREP